jgi:hypothetical protein
MFTVEFESDAAVIRSLDTQDGNEDLEVIIGDDGTVFIRQWQDWKDEYDVLCVSFQQLTDILAAINCP